MSPIDVVFFSTLLALVIGVPLGLALAWCWPRSPGRFDLHGRTSRPPRV